MSHMTIGKVVLGSGSPRSQGRATAPAAVPDRAVFEKFLQDRMKHAIEKFSDHGWTLPEDTLEQLMHYGMAGYDMAAKAGPEGLRAIGWCSGCNGPVYPGCACEKHPGFRF